MFLKIIGASTVAVLASLYSTAQLDTALLSQTLERSKDKIGKQHVMMVYKDGKVVYKKEAGEMTMKTQQPIGASSQLLTTALVLTFVQEGKLSLDDKVSDFLPIFSKYSKGYITIRHCLTHNTGIQSDQGVAKLLQKSRYNTLEEEVNDYASKRDIHTNPGTEFKYSNVGLNIAGRVLEVISKKPFNRLMQDRIIRPLAMKNTTYDNENYNDAINPANGAKSSAADMINFMAMLLNKGTFNGKTVLSESSIELLYALQAPANTLKAVPKTVEGFDFSMAGWIMESNASNKATAISIPSMSGTWPFVDFCRGYAAVLFTKEQNGEQKKDMLVKLKSLIDEDYNANCN